MNTEEKVEMYFNKFILCLEEHKGKNYKSIEDFYPVKDSLKILIETGFEYLLTDLYIYYLVYASSYRVFNSKLSNKLEERLLYYLNETIGSPAMVISNALKGYVDFLFSSQERIITNYKKNYPDMDKDFINAISIINTIISRFDCSVVLKYYIDSILNNCLAIIYAYCLYYQKQDKFNEYIKPLIDDPYKYFEELQINKLISSDNNGYLVVPTNFHGYDDITQYIISSIENMEVDTK